MFNLPEELVRYIYEFDNTYREVFTKVLHSRYEIYLMTDNFLNLPSFRHSTKYFFIFDEFSGKSFLTNSLQNPTWKTTIHTHKNIKEKYNDLHLENYKSKMKKLYTLKKVSDNLQYDIHKPLYS